VTATKLTLDERLGLCKYEIDASRSHIDVDSERCGQCSRRPCLSVCPAEVYQWVGGRVAVRYENCLECGTCQFACDAFGNRGLSWHNPAGGFGVQFRQG
jgi:ferredoxin like protein